MYLILIFVVIFLLWGYLKWIRVKNYWNKRGVPHYPPHPILGSLTFLQRLNPTLWMRQLYKDFSTDPYVGMWLFWRPALVINDPDIMRRILVKDSDNFRNHFATSGMSDPIGSLSMLMVKDPLWSSVRRRLTGVFAAAKLKIHTGIIKNKTDDLLQRIKQGTVQNEEFQLRQLFSDYTIDIIGESAFGLKSEAVKMGTSPMKEVAHEFMQFDLFRGLNWSIIFFFPELAEIFRCSLYPKKTVQKVRSIYRSEISKRGGYDKQVKEPKNLLDALIKMKQDAAAEGEEMTEDLLLAQAMIFMDGGFDTIASILSWVIYELAWAPRYQHILYEEIMTAKQKNGEDLSSGVLAELNYLNCVIKETLRLYTPMGWLDRVAANDYQIDENLTIPAGTPVYLNAVGTQMDPQFFPDPMVFNPERFLPENGGSIKPFTYLPFGSGPRICIGVRFANHVMRLALSCLICSYEFKKLPDTPIPHEVRIETNGLFFSPLDDRMKIQFVPRRIV